MKLYKIYISVLLLAFFSSTCRIISAEQISSGLAYTGATIHTVSGPLIENGTLIIRDHLIEAVGQDLAIPDGYEIISLPGHYRIYPGLIDADSNMGRIEIGSVRGTVDVSETGEIHPDVRAEIAINADSEHIPVTRSNGVLLSNTVPRGGIIAGTSALMKHQGWTWEELVIKSPVGLHLFWPKMKIRYGPPRHHWEEYKPPEKQEKERDRKLKLLKNAFAEALVYLNARKTLSGLDIDPRWEAMKPVLLHQIPLIIHANGYYEIKAALDWAEKEEYKIILAGGKDAWRIASYLKDRNIPVILSGIHGMPSRDWESYDITYAMASRLYDNHIKFCIANGGGASNNRNLPYLAARSAAFGLPENIALKSITLYPAQILGIDDRYGSLESGKTATFFTADGDILDIRTNVMEVYISGNKIKLSDRHKHFYQKYKKKPSP